MLHFSFHLRFLQLFAGSFLVFRSFFRKLENSKLNLFGKGEEKLKARIWSEKNHNVHKRICRTECVAFCKLFLLQFRYCVPFVCIIYLRLVEISFQMHFCDAIQYIHIESTIQLTRNKFCLSSLFLFITLIIIIFLKSYLLTYWNFFLLIFSLNRFGIHIFVDLLFSF